LHIRIENNNALTNVNGFSNLDSLGFFNLVGNTNLTDLSGLSHLTSFNFAINNSALTNLDQLSNLNTTGYAWITNNNNLTNIDGLSNITSYEDGTYIRIFENSVLGNVDGLSGLNTIYADNDISGVTHPIVSINNNSSLSNVDGLSNLTFIEGSLQLYDNGSLTSCCGIYSLINTPGAIQGSVILQNNAFACNNTNEITSDCKLVYIDETATGNNDGTSWPDAFTNLQDALALGARSFRIAAGTYKPTATTQREISFDIPAGSRLIGGYPNGGGPVDLEQNITILSGEIDNVSGYSGNSYHVVKVINANDVVIRGIHIKDGNADNINSFGQSRGGGIYCKGSQLKLINTTVRRNKAIYGGGIFATLSPEVILEDSEIKLNEAEYGSALYHSNETNMYLNRTRIINN